MDYARGPFTNQRPMIEPPTLGLSILNSPLHTIPSKVKITIFSGGTVV